MEEKYIIIGGGISGLVSALNLRKNHGKDVIIIEKNNFGQNKEHKIPLNISDF